MNGFDCTAFFLFQEFLFFAVFDYRFDGVVLVLLSMSELTVHFTTIDQLDDRAVRNGVEGISIHKNIKIKYSPKKQ